MAPIRRLVLDLLKPHEPTILEFSDALAECPGVAGVNAVLLETDQEVQNLKFTIEGEAIDFGAVDEVITDLGGTVHSIDEVACGDVLVEESPTPQD